MNTNNKPLRAYFEEAQEEFEYDIYSTHDILSAEIVDRIVKGFASYGLISFKPLGICKKPPKKVDFKSRHPSDYPFETIFMARITSSNPMDLRSTLELLAFHTRINKECFQVFPKGDKENVIFTDFGFTEVPSEQSQSEVGQKKVDSLMTSLMKDVADNKSVKLAKNYVTNHTKISEMIDQNVEKGYYIVERDNEEGTITGPFKECVDNYELWLDDNSTGTVREVNSFGDNLMEMKIDFEFADMTGDSDDDVDRLELQVMTVKFTDQLNDKEYDIAVKSASEDSAIEKAKDIIMNNLGGDEQRFVVKSVSNSS